MRDRDAVQLRSVAPLLANGKLIGPVTLVANGPKTIGATYAELLRPFGGAQLTIATKLDGSATIPVSTWGMGRHGGLGLIELGAAIPAQHDVEPLDLGAVCATVDTRGAPAGLVVISQIGTGFVRSLVGMHIDADDGGGMSDIVLHIASPIEPSHAGLAVIGSPLFAWFPPNPALGRANEVLVLGVAQPYRGHAKPRSLPVLAEIVGFDDLGRALLAAEKTEEREPNLVQIAGEIEDPDPPSPLKALDELDED